MNRRNFLTGLGAATVAGAWATSRATEPRRSAPSPTVPSRFPNIVLRTQDDKAVRFYDDLIRDRIVVINMIYTRCQGLCPAMT